MANGCFLVDAARPPIETPLELVAQLAPSRWAMLRRRGGGVVSVPGRWRPSGRRRPPAELRDRRRECRVLDQLLDAARAGESRPLVVRGEPGVGKTALLDYLVEHASGSRVAHASGVESEMELAYAGVHQLLTPMLDRLERLPGPQRAALRTAFGLSAGPAPDRFLVGLATLSLLADAAEEHPLLCLVDDAQWLDQRLGPGPWVRGPPPGRRVGRPGVRGPRSRRRVGGVAGAAGRGPAGGRCAGAAGGGADRAAGRAGPGSAAWPRPAGNPLALLELPRGLTPAELAGGFALPDAMPLAGRIEASFRRRLEALPEETRSLLLVAAADPVGDPVLVWQAAERLGIRAAAATPAAAAGLLEIGTRVLFRHPLVRSAAYRSASLQERQEAHRALAEATDPALDPDRRAWHRAQAAPGPDEDVAAELERSAGRAQARGGVAAAAAFLQRAVALTLDPARRAERALAAAQASLQAGAFDAALGLLATAEAGAARRVPARPGRPAARPGRLRLGSRQRCSPSAAEGRQAAGAVRPGTRAGDLLDRLGRGGRRRAPRGRRRPPGDLPRRPGPPSAAGHAASSRPAARRPCPADHRGTRRRDADVAASGERARRASPWRTSCGGAG